MTPEQAERRRAVRREWRKNWPPEQRRRYQAQSNELNRLARQRAPLSPLALERKARAERARWLEESGIVMGAEPVDHIRQWRRMIARDRIRERDRKRDRSGRLYLPRTDEERLLENAKANMRYHSLTPEQREALRQYEREQHWIMTPEERVHESRSRRLAYYTRTPEQIERDERRRLRYRKAKTPEETERARIKSKQRRANRTIQEVERDRTYSRLRQQNRSPEQRERDLENRRARDIRRGGEAFAYREIMSSLGADMTLPKGDRRRLIIEQAAAYRRIMEEGTWPTLMSLSLLPKPPPPKPKAPRRSAAAPRNRPPKRGFSNSPRISPT